MVFILSIFMVSIGYMPIVIGMDKQKIPSIDLFFDDEKQECVFYVGDNEKESIRFDILAAQSGVFHDYLHTFYTVHHMDPWVFKEEQRVAASKEENTLTPNQSRMCTFTRYSYSTEKLMAEAAAFARCEKAVNKNPDYQNGIWLVLQRIKDGPFDQKNPGDVAVALVKARDIGALVIKNDLIDHFAHLIKQPKREKTFLEKPHVLNGLFGSSPLSDEERVRMVQQILVDHEDDVVDIPVRLSYKVDSRIIKKLIVGNKRCAVCFDDKKKEYSVIDLLKKREVDTIPREACMNISFAFSENDALCAVGLRKNITVYSLEKEKRKNFNIKSDTDILFLEFEPSRDNVDKDIYYLIVNAGYKRNESWEINDANDLSTDCLGSFEQYSKREYTFNAHGNLQTLPAVVNRFKDIYSSNNIATHVCLPSEEKLDLVSDEQLLAVGTHSGDIELYKQKLTESSCEFIYKRSQKRKVKAYPQLDQYLFKKLCVVESPIKLASFNKKGDIIGAVCKDGTVCMHEHSFLEKLSVCQALLLRFALQRKQENREPIKLSHATPLLYKWYQELPCVDQKAFQEKALFHICKQGEH